MPAKPSSLRALQGHPHAKVLDAAVAAAIAAVEPARAVAMQLDWLTPDALRMGEVVQSFVAGAQVHVIAAGKAATGMLQGALEKLGGLAHPRVGRIVSVGPSMCGPTDARHLGFVGGHPLPNAGSLDAGRAALALADDAGPHDLVLALVSGGASAMLCAPQAGINLAKIQRLTEVLQARPVDIATLNSARATVDRMKFGGLLRAATPARCGALILSDVPGDDLDVVGGGPTRARAVDPQGLEASLSQAGAWGELPAELQAVLRAYTAPPALPKRRAFDQLVASNAHARHAACRAAETHGLRGVDLGGGLRGETETAVAQLFAELARPELAAFGPPPRLALLGGESVVRRRQTDHAERAGRGGRGLNFALAALPKLAPGRTILTFATDGADGNSGAAGAVVNADTWARAQALGLDPADYLARDDAANFFAKLGDLWVTGPSGTNVCDLVFVHDGDPT